MPAWTLLPAFRNLVEASAGYVAGNTSISDLDALLAEFAEGCADLRDREAMLFIAEWRYVVGRRRNEWGFVRDPMPEDEFVEWMRLQLQVYAPA